VEMDECFVGGKPRPKNDHDDDDKPGRAKGKWTKDTKTPVVGMVERKGKVKAKPVGRLDLRASHMEELVRKGVDTDNSMLLTDTSAIYNRMADVIRHKQVNHRRTYADALVHTNTIESFWAILKRGIMGQFHRVSDKYLDRYVDEFAYRYNGRELDGAVLFDNTVCRMLKA